MRFSTLLSLGMAAVVMVMMSMASSATAFARTSEDIRLASQDHTEGINSPVTPAKTFIYQSSINDKLIANASDSSAGRSRHSQGSAFGAMTRSYLANLTFRAGGRDGSTRGTVAA